MFPTSKALVTTSVALVTTSKALVTRFALQGPNAEVWTCLADRFFVSGGSKASRAEEKQGRKQKERPSEAGEQSSQGCLFLLA